MKEWEYRILDWAIVPTPEGGGGELRSFKLQLSPSSAPRNVEAYLNHLGSEGWEVVTISFAEPGAWEGFTGLAKREK